MTPRRERDDESSGTGTVRSYRDGATPSAASELCLHVIGGTQVSTHPLPSSGRVVVGRSTNADIQIDEPSVSRRHLVIDMGPPMRVEDLGSANGVRAGDRTLRAGDIADVAPGVLLELGSVMLVIQRGELAARPKRLWSHGYFEARVEDECARGERTGTSFAVVRVHVGSGAPDETAHATLSQASRSADVLAVYGPGEYELLLVDTGPEEAHRLEQQIASLLARSGLEARMGIACYPRDSRTPDALIAKACEAVRGGRSTEESHAFVGETMRRVERIVERIAHGTIGVLVLGETGVGKELVAELVHKHSPRAGKAFVRLNCAALSESLVASELFGHERGAFTGAHQAKAGLLESAHGGTVFLDEVGELPIALQPKLLRVLEERQVMRVGALRPRPIDVRFVAATNRNLEVEVVRGRFREDLLFRLNGFSVVVPPLRERVGEIEELATHFVGVAAREAGRRRAPTLSAEAVSTLTGYAWPGNVRELRNVTERAVLLCVGDTITLEHLPLDKLHTRVASPTAPAAGAVSARVREPARSTRDSYADVLRAELRERERQQLVDALARCGGNQTHAAKLLGISRGTLLARMDAFGLDRPRKR
jgi:DNA-binding NtrC family response regulator